MAGTLHFTCGKMAAGKSTLARRLAVEQQAVLIGWDLWLSRLYPVEIQGFDDFLKYSARLRTAIAPHLSELLRAGQNVVMDYPANTPAARAWIRTVFESASASHCLHFVDTTNERCLAQLAQRNANLPEDSVLMTAQQFYEITSLFVPPAEAEGFVVRRYTGTG